MIVSILKHYIRSIAVGLLILLVSLIPLGVSGERPWFYFPGLDKVVHGLMYALFIVAFLSDYLRRGTWKRSVNIWLVVITFSMSALIELIQHYLVESRSGEALDLLANFGGLVVGWLFVCGVRKIRSGSCRDHA